MVKFKRLFYKNFLSTGEQGHEILLDKSPTTLIVGKSGSGKTTIIDALFFCLYNKAFRNITKKQLVNTINTKNCYVEVEFEVAGKSYKVCRGIKPDVFEIYEDGVIMDSQANSRDQQTHLIDNILKINEASFKQIVVLGSRTYVPFMQLTAGERRTMTEEILDIGIFSEMNSIVKEGIVALKAKKSTLESDANTIKQKIDIHQGFVEREKARQGMETDAIETDIADAKAKIEKLDGAITKLEAVTSKYTNALQVKTKVLSADQKCRVAIAENNSTINSHNKTVTFFNGNDSCPTCRQSISIEHKGNMLKDAENAIQGLVAKNEAINTKHNDIKNKIAKLEELTNKLNDAQKKLEGFNATKRQLQNNITVLDDKLRALKGTDASDISEYLNKISVLEAELNKVQDSIAGVDTDLQYSQYMLTLFKDNGIKSQIIKEYLPKINTLLNKYLNDLGLSIAFELDENFNETFKSRYRDAFKYQNFSQGEQLRIDLAFVFTWLEIAKMKNKVSTNIIIMDEVLDSSLDSESSENFLDVMTKVLQNSNVFVISHKETIGEHFRNTINFEKVDGFSIKV